MKKVKNYFFNKVERNNLTTKGILFSSFIKGFMKILLMGIILMVFASIISTVSLINDSDILMVISGISSMIFLLGFFLYIILNRIPNQIRVFKNYNTTKMIGSNYLVEKEVRKKQRLKKFAFFYILFHLIGYVSYLLKITPHIKIEHSYSDDFYYNDGYRYYFFLTQDSKIFKGCSDKFKQSDFWPFFDWSYGCGVGKYGTSGFPGIYGYYDHWEFLFYVGLPAIIIILSWIYKKFMLM